MRIEKRNASPLTTSPARAPAHALAVTGRIDAAERERARIRGGGFDQSGWDGQRADVGRRLVSTLAH
jgi:hypothetical protein